MQAEAQATANAMVVSSARVTGHTDGTTDGTLHLTEGALLKSGAGNDGGGRYAGVQPSRFVPQEMTFKVGETVNFTFKPQEQSGFSHYVMVTELGIKQPVKYDKIAIFTHIFDKAGIFRVFCQTHF